MVVENFDLVLVCRELRILAVLPAIAAKLTHEAVQHANYFRYIVGAQMRGFFEVLGGCGLNRSPPLNANVGQVTHLKGGKGKINICQFGWELSSMYVSICWFYNSIYFKRKEN